jgi:hypothetical protein
VPGESGAHHHGLAAYHLDGAGQGQFGEVAGHLIQRGRTQWCRAQRRRGGVGPRGRAWASPAGVAVERGTDGQRGGDHAGDRGCGGQGHEQARPLPAPAGTPGRGLEGAEQVWHGRRFPVVARHHLAKDVLNAAHRRSSSPMPAGTASCRKTVSPRLARLRTLASRQPSSAAIWGSGRSS